MNTVKDINHFEEVNCQFSEAVFQKMATKRYGIQFCCENDLQSLIIKKELLRLNSLKSDEFPTAIIPEPLPIPEPPTPSCMSLSFDDFNLCHGTWVDYFIFMTSAEYSTISLIMLFNLNNTFPNLYTELQTWVPEAFKTPCCKDTSSFRAHLETWMNTRPSTTPSEDNMVNYLVPLVIASLNLLYQICETYGLEYTAWEEHEFDDDWLPVVLQTIQLNYYNCFGVKITETIKSHFTRCVQEPGIINYTCDWSNSKNIGTFDINSFMTASYTIVPGECLS